MLSHELKPGPASGPPAAHVASHKLGGADILESKLLTGYATVNGAITTTTSGYGLFASGIPTDASSAISSTSDGVGFQQTSAATTGSDACYSYPISARFDTAGLPAFRVKVKFDTVANVRYFYGLSSDNGPGTVDADDPAAYQCAFQFSSGRDSNWMISLDDNGTQVLTDTSILAAVGVYWFDIEVTVAGSCKFTMRDSTGAELYSETISSDVPSAGNLLYFVIGGETQANVAINPIVYCLEVRT